MFAHVDPFAPRRWGRLIAMEWLYAMPEQLLRIIAYAKTHVFSWFHRVFDVR
jgi:hypothetical protein